MRHRFVGLILHYYALRNPLNKTVVRHTGWNFKEKSIHRRIFLESRIQKKFSHLRRFKIYQIEEVLPFTVFSKKDPLPHRIYDGKKVKMTSLRYQLFAKKGVTCVECGLEGKYFALEQDPAVANQDAWHFNLYALDKDGNEILMTKDHINPRSKGGKDNLNNFQTMCYVCNQIKGSKT